MLASPSQQYKELNIPNIFKYFQPHNIDQTIVFAWVEHPKALLYSQELGFVGPIVDRLIGQAWPIWGRVLRAQHKLA